MSDIKIGDKIEQKDLKAMGMRFPMEVLAVEPCETDPTVLDGEPHDSYKVIDPEGQEDWICAADVVKVS